MLGDLIYEATTKAIGTRVIDENGTMEITLQEQGKIFGIECTVTVTFVNKPRHNGVMYSEGYGVLLTKDGDTATLTLSGITIPKGAPPLGSVRGVAFCCTQSPKLGGLNSVVCIYEAETNDGMIYNVKGWEWK
ncbi:hypothetical protein ACSAZL_07525 [Methanosarcina sp. T3]|uniref:hypothetical protein n=1 Tax=Methanosarcina sp. T3 TaxID=3439062 RepID=UPI003F85F825